MNNYRKKDVITDSDINTFETIEINKIKENIVPRKSFLRRFRLVLIAPVILLAFIFSVNVLDGDKVNPALKDIKVAELKTISLSDLPVSLQGLRNETASSNLRFLSSYTLLATSLTFEDQEDVTGEGQLKLEEIINDQEMTDEAKSIFNDLYENIMFLEVDELTTFDDVHEYFFVVNEDGTYKLTMQIQEDNQISIVEVSTYYLDDEFFYQVTLEVNAETESSLYKIKYNSDQTKKYQYAKYETDTSIAESYILIEEIDDATSVVALHKVDGDTYQIIADANDLHGVIFSYYSTIDVSYTSTEYYNQDGALLKQEYGFDDLSIFNYHLEEMYAQFEENPDITTKNLSNIIVDFNDPEKFTIEVLLLDSALATIQEVPATLIIEDLSYDIDFTYSNLLHSKKEDTFTSGDALYHITNSEVTETSIILTYSVLYQVPDAVEAPTGENYYIVHKYMAKYIQAKEGFSIEQKPSGKYQLLNNEILGQLGDRIDIEIEEESYYLDGELSPTLIFQHTSDVQFENLVFTQMSVINAARVNLDELYDELMPTDEYLQENYQSIDVSMFTN